MLHSNDHCQNRKLTVFVFTTRITDVTRGTNQQSMTQTPSRSKYRSQIHRNTETISKFPPTLSPILKKSDPTPVTIQLPSNGARRYLVYTNRCRGHHLYRRQNGLVTTSKTTKRGFPSPPPKPHIQRTHLTITKT